MQTHVKVLAVLFIVLGVLGVLAAFGIMAIFGGTMGIVGATSQDEGAAIAIPILGLTGTMLTVFLLVLSIPGLVTGFGLLSFKGWARILGIVLSALNLINIPFGTIMGVYGLWVLLSKETEPLFDGSRPLVSGR